MADRPQRFRFDGRRAASDGVVCAGLGRHVRSSRFTDSSLRRNHGTFTGEPADWVWDSYLGRWALNLATDDYLAFPAMVMTQPFGFGLWCTTANRTAENKFLFSWGYNAASSLLLYQTGTAWRFLANAGTLSWSSSATPPANDTWVHLYVTLAGDLITLYVNGVAVNSNSNAAWPNSTPAAAWHVGYASPRALAGSYWAGKISDVIVHNGDIGAARIARLADPSNTMLSGLILPPKRRIWAAVTAAPPATNRRRRLLIAGTCA